MLFDESSEVEIDHPTRRHESIFHGQAELTGSVRIDSTTFMTELKENCAVEMHPHDEVNMLRWLVGKSSKRILVERQTTATCRTVFEQNLETIIEKAQIVELPKYRMSMAANFQLLKNHPNKSVNHRSMRTFVRNYSDHLPRFYLSPKFQRAKKRTLRTGLIFSAKTFWTKNLATLWLLGWK